VIFFDNMISRARTILMVAGAVALALMLGECDGHRRGVADDKADAQVQFDKVQRQNDTLTREDALHEDEITRLTAQTLPEVLHVDTYIPAGSLTPVALPDPGYNNAFVCLWNLPIHASTDRPDPNAASACVDAPDAQGLSAVTRDDLYTNEQDNLGKCAAAYVRVNTLQQELHKAGVPYDDHTPR
jgi:hypothetical protein